MAQFAVATSQQVTIGSDGTATSQTFGPSKHGEEWTIQRYTVSCTGPCTVTAYRGNVGHQQLDVTTSGASDTSEWVTPLVLKGSDRIIFQWTQGVAGSVALISIEGIGTF